MSPLLEVKNLRTHFYTFEGVVKAVDGVSLNIPEGTTYGLVGESGSGKTTTARMILMVESPTEGEVKYMGQSLSDFSNSDRRAFQSSIAAVFQDPWSSLNPRMRVRSIVGEPLEIATSMTKGQIATRVGDLLSETGLNPYQANLYPHEFSGGQRQRLGIARALIKNAPILILDEPTASMDAISEAEVFSALEPLRANRTILVIAHRLATIRHATRILVLHGGQLIAQGTHEELMKSNDLYRRMWIRLSVGRRLKETGAVDELLKA
mgnify:CR=1 FL=1